MFIEGITDIIRVPIAFILRICHDFLNWIGAGNYLFALLLFALIMQIILLPFGIKQQKNSIRQAKLAPKVAAIRNKYKGRTDKATQQKIQEETMALYQKEHFNPMSGCLPLLIQMPILFALFRVITMPMRYLASVSTEAISKMINLVNGLAAKGVTGIEAIKSSDAYAQIKLVSNLRVLGESASNGLAKAAGVADFDFSRIPNFKMFGGSIDLSEAPYASLTKGGGFNWSWMILIPIITVGALFLSQWLTKKFTYQDPTQAAAQKGCSMKVMMYALPFLSGYFALMYAAAIGIYWIFRNLLSVLQQFILSKAMPLPVFTEEDYKEAEREMYKTQTKKRVKGERDPNRPKVRSLHHIDDDDDEEYVSSGSPTKYDDDEGDEAPVKELEAASGSDGEESAEKAEKTEPEDKKDDGEKATKLNGVIVEAPIKDDKGTKYKKKK
ncbi:MAG: membrane protein insertase YidC [Clostridia bacterium]|nr:membrane protein insertase YidC [Clostridia bacterium]